MIYKMRQRKTFETIRPTRMGKIRRIVEEREKNINFRNAIVRAQHRHNLRIERDRLHGLLYTQLSPALHEKVRADGNMIFQIVGNT